MAAVIQQLPGVTLLRLARAGAIAAALLLPVAASAQGIVLAGRMGDRALLVVDGQPRTVAIGQSVAGVRLLRWIGDGSDASAEIDQGGRIQQLRIGGSPAQLGAAAPRTSWKNGGEIVIPAGPGGHFTTAGTINGRQVVFMVDTGATLVSLGRDDAVRLGLDLANARSAMTNTANGAVPVQLVTLASVRVGDVELTNVGAAVVPQAMPLVLLGNSFLARLQMRRDNDIMRLQLR